MLRQEPYVYAELLGFGAEDQAGNELGRVRAVGEFGLVLRPTLRRRLQRAPGRSRLAFDELVWVDRINRTVISAGMSAPSGTGAAGRELAAGAVARGGPRRLRRRSGQRRVRVAHP